jgi:D-alanyl-D-alanine carboxypeptidase
MFPRAPASGPATTDAGDDLESQLRADLEAYLHERGAAEHVSAAGLSVSLPDRRWTIDVSAGTTTFGGSLPVRPDSVWQIGSNTKALTSVLLQLEAKHRLSIDDPLGRWLPQYAQWGDVTIRRLLNMTSGIATYDEQPAFLTDYAADPSAYFSPERLVAYAIGRPGHLRSQLLEHELHPRRDDHQAGDRDELSGPALPPHHRAAGPA